MTTTLDLHQEVNTDNIESIVLRWLEESMPVAGASPDEVMLHFRTTSSIMGWEWLEWANEIGNAPSVACLICALEDHLKQIPFGTGFCCRPI